MSGNHWHGNTADFVVYPSFVPRMHPSRTRAFGAPDLTPYVELHNEDKSTSQRNDIAQKEEHRAIKKEKKRNVEKQNYICVSVPRLEACSAFFSFAALGFAIFFIICASASCGPNYNPEFPLWWSDITIVNLTDAEKMQAVSDFSNAWQATCSANKAELVNGTQLILQDSSLQLLPGTRRIETGFRPMYALVWIFFFSCVMQVSRSYHKFIADLFDYDATGKVEITRWLEYALTSPLQIWIVASLFFVGDIMTLIALAAAQLGLVLLGALIEYFNGRARKKERKGSARKAQAAYYCAYATLFLAWVIHTLIWLPLYLRFRYEIDKSDTCVEGDLKDSWDEARFYVELTFYLQFSLFSAFWCFADDSYAI